MCNLLVERFKNLDVSYEYIFKVKKNCKMIYGILNIFMPFGFQEAQNFMLNCYLLRLTKLLANNFESFTVTCFSYTNFFSSVSGPVYNTKNYSKHWPHIMRLTVKHTVSTKYYASGCLSSHWFHTDNFFVINCDKC
jgi:hypothetical protein